MGWFQRDEYQRGGFARKRRRGGISMVAFVIADNCLAARLWGNSFPRVDLGVRGVACEYVLIYHPGLLAVELNAKSEAVADKGCCRSSNGTLEPDCLTLTSS